MISLPGPLAPPPLSSRGVAPLCRCTLPDGHPQCDGVGFTNILPKPLVSLPINRHKSNTGGGIRTHTGVTAQRILSPQRLPFRHAGVIGTCRTFENRKAQECGLDRLLQDVRPAGPGLPGSSRLPSGGGGIRTHGWLAPSTVFKTVPIDHSGTPPSVVSSLFPTIYGSRSCHCSLTRSGWRQGLSTNRWYDPTWNQTDYPKLNLHNQDRRG